MNKISDSRLQFVIWDNSSEESLRRAEARKIALENKGYTLVDQSESNLTYVLIDRTKRSQNNVA
jgi:hypothetical protein